MAKSKPFVLDREASASIKRRVPFEAHGLIGYYSVGGSYLLASPGMYQDDGDPRDLVLVLPADFGRGTVFALTPLVNPALIEAVEAVVGP